MFLNAYEFLNVNTLGGNLFGGFVLENKLKVLLIFQCKRIFFIQDDIQQQCIFDFADLLNVL